MPRFNNWVGIWFTCILVVGDPREKEEEERNALMSKEKVRWLGLALDCSSCRKMRSAQLASWNRE